MSPLLWRAESALPVTTTPLLVRVGVVLDIVVAAAVDLLLEDRRGFEHHDAARRNRHFLAGLGIAADPLAFLADHERSERRKLHGLTALEAIGDFLENLFDKRGRFRARQADLLVD